MQRRYVWALYSRSRFAGFALPRLSFWCDLVVWVTDEAIPLQDFAVQQQQNTSVSTSLLLGRPTTIDVSFAVIRGEPVSVRGRKRPIELLFNLEHPITWQL